MNLSFGCNIAAWLGRRGNRQPRARGAVAFSEVGSPIVYVTQLTAIGAVALAEVGAATVDGTFATAVGVEASAEVGSPSVYITGLTATGVESASEVGSPTVTPSALFITATGVEAAAEVGTATVANIAPAMSNVEYDDTDTISIDLDEPATIYWMVDDNDSRTGSQVETGGGEASGSFAVTTGSNTETINVSGVTAGDYYLHIVAKDSGGLFSDVSSTEYTFAGPIEITATGVEASAEVGSPTVYVTSLTAIGAESASETGAAALVSGVWSYSGSVVTNLPASEGWEFTGSVVDTIPAAA